MIENFEPSLSVRTLAPAITAIIFTGDVAGHVELADLALGLESGDVVPLGKGCFVLDGMLTAPPSGPDPNMRFVAYWADLLQCEPSATTLQRVASLALLQATHDVAERRRDVARAKAAAPQKPRFDPTSGSLESLLSAMDAADVARKVTPST